MFLVALLLKTLVLFMAVANAKRIYDAGQMTLFWKCVVFLPAVSFYILDVAFMNWVLGTAMYRELPKWGEWTFSARTRRQVAAGSRVAAFWKVQINIFLPGHI